MADTILKVDNINVYYGNIHAVKGVSFEVNEGEYKVMGLSAFGEPKFRGEFERLIELRPEYVTAPHTLAESVAAVGTGGVFLTVPMSVAELFDARLGPLVGILVVGLALVAAAVVLTRRAAR